MHKRTQSSKSDSMAVAQYQLSLFSNAQNKRLFIVLPFALVYYKQRFDTEQVSDIKSALDLFREDRQSHRLGSAAHERASLRTSMPRSCR